MKSGALGLGLALASLVVGCSKNQEAKIDQPIQTATVAPDKAV